MLSAIASAAAIPLIAIVAAGIFYCLHRGSESRSQQLLAVLVPVWPVFAFCCVLALYEIQSPPASSAPRFLGWLSFVIYLPILILAYRRKSGDDRRIVSLLVSSVAGVALLMLADILASGDWP